MVSECDRLILSFSRAAATEDEYLGAADFEAFVSCAAEAAEPQKKFSFKLYTKIFPEKLENNGQKYQVTNYICFFYLNF